MLKIILIFVLITRVLVANTEYGESLHLLDRTTKIRSFDCMLTSIKENNHQVLSCIRNIAKIVSNNSLVCGKNEFMTVIEKNIKCSNQSVMKKINNKYKYYEGYDFIEIFVQNATADNDTIRVTVPKENINDGYYFICYSLIMEKAVKYHRVFFYIIGHVAITALVICLDVWIDMLN